MHRDLSTDPQADLSCVLDMYSASFTDKQGHTDSTTHSINTEVKGPVFSQPYRLCSEWKQQVKEELDCLLTSWGNPGVHEPHPSYLSVNQMAGYAFA